MPLIYNGPFSLSYPCFLLLIVNPTSLYKVIRSTYLRTKAQQEKCANFNMSSTHADAGAATSLSANLAAPELSIMTVAISLATMLKSTACEMIMAVALNAEPPIPGTQPSGLGPSFPTKIGLKLAR